MLLDKRLCDLPILGLDLEARERCDCLLRHLFALLISLAVFGLASMATLLNA
jgi:hypothetical protein